MNFTDKVLSAQVEQGQVGVFFLGQAGFIFKTASGMLTALDPYLSNCCEKEFGFKRLMPQILQPKDITFDALLISHAHYDHFDPESVPILMQNGTTKLVGAKDILPECERLHITGEITTLSVNDTATVGDLTVTALPCDHGELAPDAVGLLIETAGKRIFFMGDTAYRPENLEHPSLQNLDLLILPINGAFGNLNEQQAARVIAKLQPKMSVPCHYWNFAEHGGNPGLFQEAVKEICPQAQYTLMCQGEMITL